MPQPISIIKRIEQGFTEFGLSAESSESYIKLSTSLRRSSIMHSLRGSRLHVFIIVALHEADDQPGASLRTIHAETGISIPTIIDAIKFLSDPAHPFIVRDGQESDGTNRYRPCSLAWHGTREEGSKETLLPHEKNISPCHDDVLNQSTIQESHHDMVEKILVDAGFQGTAPSRLAALIDEKVASAWAAWVRVSPDRYRNPYGYAYTQLMKDPTAMPPATSRKKGVIDPSLKRFIHGTKEHEDYLREHPEFANCKCLEN